MKIAGVGVNVNKLPTREQLIEQALKSKEFYQKRNARELIEQEIKESGLFKATVKRSKKSNSKPAKDSGGRGDNKQPEHNKASKE